MDSTRKSRNKKLHLGFIIKKAKEYTHYLGYRNSLGTKMLKKKGGRLCNKHVYYEIPEEPIKSIKI